MSNKTQTQNNICIVYRDKYVPKRIKKKKKRQGKLHKEVNKGVYLEKNEH